MLSLVNNCKVALKDHKCPVTPQDEAILKEFYTLLLDKVKDFCKNLGDIKDKNILFLMSQVRLGNEKSYEQLQHPYMILHSEGGIGKPYLIADTVNKRNNQEQRSLLLLGQDFPAGCVIWTRFSELLEMRFPIDVILQRVSDIAEARKTRVLLFFDAINEGGGRELWKDKLAVLVEKVKRLYAIAFGVLSFEKDREKIAEVARYE